MNFVEDVVADEKIVGIRCSCGALCKGKQGQLRFRKRHPTLCDDRREFNHQLAQNVRSVPNEERENDAQRREAEEES